MAVLHIPGVPANRAADLLARINSGSLTDAEKLAVAVLRGGENGEGAIAGLLDACIESYSHGSYRVPVRVLCDPKRLLVVLSSQYKLPRATMVTLREQLLEILRAGLSGRVIVLDNGMKVEFYELPESNSGPRVDVVAPVEADASEPAPG